MNSLLKSAARKIPGARKLARYFSPGAEAREAYPPGHFYSPVPDLADVRARAGRLFRRDADAVPGIDLRADAQWELFRQLAGHLGDFDWADAPAPGRRFHLGQNFYGPGSAFVLFALLRHFRPRRVIEVGSGFSSALMLDADEAAPDGAGRTAFTFVEPYPENRLNGLLRPADAARATLVKDVVQNVPLSAFEALEDGDFLFIDSSHVSRVGSDVNYLFFEVLPALKPGVVVHVHDVYWPFEYPEHWVMEGRAWNEAYLLRAFLQYNERFQILLFNNFLAQRRGPECRELVPLFAKDPGSSIWLRKV